MQITEDLKSKVLAKTDGHCYYCRKQLAFSNHGVRNGRGAWHIDHKVSQFNGGTDEFSNLIAACICCNEDKSSLNAASYRRMTKPLRVKRREEAILAELEGIAFIALILAVIGSIDVYGWWKRRKSRAMVPTSGYTETLDLPWVGILSFFAIVFMFAIVIRSNKLT